MNSLGKIEHIVLLMFENRSFDNILGTLYPSSYESNGHGFAALPPNSHNTIPARPGGNPSTRYQVWNSTTVPVDWYTHGL